VTPPETAPPLSPAEAGAVAAFEKTPAGRAWDSAFNVTGPHVARIMEEWGKEMMSARLAHDPGAAATVAGADPVIARFLSLSLEYSKRVQEEGRKYNAQLDAAGMEAVLAPAQLVSAEGIAQSRRTIASMEKAMEAWQRDVATLQREFHETVKKIDAPEQKLAPLLKSFEAGLAQNYDLQLRFAENQRTLIDLFRRVLSLAEKETGRLRLEGNRLVFDDANEVETYRSLVVQIQTAAAEEQKLLKEGEAQRQRAQALMKGSAGNSR
jgi:hypothetical protein